MDIDGIQETDDGTCITHHEPRNIRVHIERIVLNGIDIPSHQHLQLQAAVEAELIRLLAMDNSVGQWQVGRAVNSLSGGTLPLTVENHPGQLGRQIAQAVYGGIIR